MKNDTISRGIFIKGIVAGLAGILLLGGIQAGEYYLEKNAAKHLPAVTPTASSGLSFTPGEYSASAAGLESDVTVNCTFDETTMTDLIIDVSGETAGIGAEIGAEMREKILSSQSSEVDGVSGATISSDAVKTAVADCIAQASAG